MATPAPFGRMRRKAAFPRAELAELGSLVTCMGVCELLVPKRRSRSRPDAPPCNHRRRAEDQVKCDLRSSEMGCHRLSGLAATLVKRPIEIIEAWILPARLRVTQQVEGLHSLVPPRPLRRLPQSILCPTPYEVIAPFRQSRIRPRIRIMVDGRADLPGSRGNHGAGCGPHCGKSLRSQPAKRPGYRAFPDRPKRSAGRSNA